MSNDDIKALSFTREQVKYKRLVSKLVENHILAVSEEIDREGRFPAENIKLLGEHGILGLGISASKGGIGGDFVAMTLVLEELAKGCSSTAMSYLMHSTTIPYLSAIVSEEQHASFLQPIIEGKYLGALSMSEPKTGSRLWHMTSHAHKEGNEYVINSFKSFVTNSKHADFYIVPVRSSENSLPNELSVFWIDGKDKNIKPIGDWDGMGLRGNSSTPVHFEDCRVPEFNRIGEKDSGFSLLMAYVLPIYFVGMAAVYLGIAEKAYKEAVKRAKARKYTGPDDSGKNLESIQRYIGEMKSKLCTLRASVYRCARMVNQVTKVFDMLCEAGLLVELLDNAQKDTFFIELAQLKIASTETAQFVTDKALQVGGGQCYKRGNIIEQCFRDARAGSLMGPSNDILKVIIGKRELGLPYPWETFEEEKISH